MRDWGFAIECGGAGAAAWGRFALRCGALPKEELDRATQSMLRYQEQQHRLKLGSTAGAQMASAPVPEDQDQIAA